MNHLKTYESLFPNWFNKTKNKNEYLKGIPIHNANTKEIIYVNIDTFKNMKQSEEFHKLLYHTGVSDQTGHWEYHNINHDQVINLIEMYKNIEKYNL